MDAQVHTCLLCVLLMYAHVVCPCYILYGAYVLYVVYKLLLVWAILCTIIHAL